MDDIDDDYDDDYDDGPDYGDIDPDLVFADPGGRSALRAATPDNPRVHPCPNCERPNMLTQRDVNHGYQCDRCADAAENGWDY